MGPTFSLLSIASSKVAKLGKAEGDSVIATTAGDADCAYDAEVYEGHGSISRPSKKTKGIRIRLGSLSIIIAAYTYGIDPPANPGAKKLYSTDADGAEKASMLLDSDGKIGAKNASEQLAKLMDDLITEIKSIQTFGSPTNHALMPTNITNLTTIATRFKSLFKEI
jgi:hypothetical protein